VAKNKQISGNNCKGDRRRDLKKPVPSNPKESQKEKKETIKEEKEIL